MRTDVSLSEIEQRMKALNSAVTGDDVMIRPRFRIQKDYRKNSPYVLMYGDRHMAEGTKKYIYDVITAIYCIALSDRPIEG